MKANFHKTFWWIVGVVFGGTAISMVNSPFELINGLIFIASIISGFGLGVYYTLDVNEKDD